MQIILWNVTINLGDVMKNKGENKKRKRLGNRITDVIFILVLIVFCVWQDNDLTVTRLNYINSKIPVAFDGYKIVQISDLHNKSFGAKNKRLLESIEKEQPDIIVITGDIVDKFRTNQQVAVDFVGEACKIASVYYVSGNHESWIDDYDILASDLSEAGAIVLDNKVQTVTINDESIDIIGLKDYDFYSGVTANDMVKESANEFRILLSHQPQLINEYADSGVDLVFSGHAHGGQVRLPVIGGLYAPNQGVFPDYTAGMYTVGNTTMCVSRGLGNSVCPIRVFNRPEIVVLTLQSE